MRSVETKATICVDDMNIQYRVCDLDYTEYEDGTYEYNFYPRYTVIELLKNNTKIYQGIPGLNLDLKKKVYCRKNIIPVFISERTPGENRENLYQMLEDVGMEYLNRLEWLIRTDLQYFGDYFYVIRREDENINIVKEYDDIEYMGSNLFNVVKKLLTDICKGETIYFEGLVVDDKNRKIIHDLLFRLYKKSYEFNRKKIVAGVERAKIENKYKGRKKKSLGIIEDELVEKYIKNKIGIEECLQRLGISRSTFFRRVKDFKKYYM